MEDNYHLAKSYYYFTEDLKKDYSVENLHGEDFIRITLNRTEYEKIILERLNLEESQINRIGPFCEN